MTEWWVFALAALPVLGLLAGDPALASGLSTHHGALTNLQVAHDLGLPYADPHTLISA